MMIIVTLTRNILKSQAVNFSDLQEFKDLQACLDDVVKMKLQSSFAPA